jgi:hypothetical protein
LEARAFEQKAVDDPYAAREELPTLASSYIFAKRYRDSLTSEKEKLDAYDKIEEGQRLRLRAVMLIVGSPAGRDLQWVELSKKAEEIERSLAEAV